MTSQEHWQLVLERNPLADGQFVYAVRSTGVYCRPTCPSRRPRPEQVEFFERSKDAERAGYRACFRCHPSSVSPQSDAVAAVCRFLEVNVDRPVVLSELGREVSLSPFHLQRVFKEQTGVSPRQYQSALRAQALRKKLGRASSVTESVYDAGYSSSSRFYESAARELGMPPSTWRKGGRGQAIQFTTFASPLGLVLLAATEKGVCFLALADDEKQLESELRAQFPAAAIERNENALRGHVDMGFEYLSGKRPHPELPLDVQATAFQSRVWQMLRGIPPGETRTYSEIAHALESPEAVRAVARACATNPVSLAIPCHRVVRKTGHLAGYRWGLQRKERLLQLERKPSAS
jgi:AraC family transcriptional regulator, regulatory protein of adaptative response / methylated-DNA-[protein]-cysteine methyltransferase